MSVEIPVGQTETKTQLRVPARFQLRGELGRGGMAFVYRAYDTAGEREVALKFLPPTDDESAKKRFQREAVDLAVVFHPNVVDFYSLGEFQGQEFIEMEYISGGTLGRFQRNCDSLKQIFEVYAKVCEGLHHIHQCGLIHRDIKPANVLMTEDGQPKISDLGLARREAGRTQLTQAGTILGTASYLAPEQLMSHEVGPGADIYALGVCIFEAACCEQPFKASTPMAMVRAHLQDKPPTPSTVMPGLPQSVDKLILSLLNKDPKDRPSDLNKLAQDLRDIAGGLTPAQDALVATSGEALLGKARLHRQSGDLESALKLLAQVEDVAPVKLQMQAKCERVRVLLQQQDPSAMTLAQQTVDECRKTDDIKALGMALVVYGQAALQAKDWDLALSLLQEARELVPSNDYDLQLELLGALAQLHDEGSQVGVASLSEEKSKRFREIASGLMKRRESTAIQTPAVGAVAAVTVEAPAKAKPKSAPVKRSESATSMPPRRLLLVLPALLLLCLVAGAYWFLTRPSRLEIISTPEGATVLVNEDRYTSPFQGELKAGTYTIKVFQQGYHPWEKEVTLTSGGSMQVAASLEPASGNLNLTSKPVGAKVFVNGQARGVTPANLTGLAIKPYKVKLVKDGYKPYEETVDVHGGKTRNLAFSMTKKPPPPPVYRAPSPSYSSYPSYSGSTRSSGSSSSSQSYKAPPPPKRSQGPSIRIPQVRVRAPKIKIRY